MTLAYETHEYREHRIKAYYLGTDYKLAQIEIWKGDRFIRHGLVLAYHIYNYSAHLTDVIDSLLSEGS